MKRLYKLGSMVTLEGVKLDHKLFGDDELESAAKDGWGDPFEIVRGKKTEVIDTNGSGKMSVAEIRAAAKEAGIEGWENKRIKTLKQELGVNGN